MSIKFVDLALQYEALKQPITSRMQAVLNHGKYIMGPEVEELEGRLAHFTGASHCITCSSGTEALLISMMALGIGPGDEVITSPEPAANGVTQMGSVADGVIASNAAERAPEESAPADDNKVYVYSDKNVSWDAAGKLSIGVNQITKKQHQLWSSKSYVRLATDEEIQGSGLI